MPDQDKYCVDFQRKAGSAILFYEHANEYIDLLKLWNNTTIEWALNHSETDFILLKSLKKAKYIQSSFLLTSEEISIDNQISVQLL